MAAFDTGNVETKSNSLTHAVAHDGTAYACASLGEGRGAIGPYSVVAQLPTAHAGVSGHRASLLIANWICTCKSGKSILYC